MSFNPEPSASRTPDLLLALGGTVGVVLGILVLLKGQQPLIQRSATVLIGACFLLLGAAGLLQASRPALAGRLKFAGKVLAGFSLFSISWTLSH